MFVIPQYLLYSWQLLHFINISWESKVLLCKQNNRLKFTHYKTILNDNINNYNKENIEEEQVVLIEIGKKSSDILSTIH